jgi:cytoskeleton protein RodZ
VFEIGSSLREARLRRKLELSDVEHDTHIRLKYLMALEDDRFDALPGAAYAKGFLRTYADYLGLDGPRFVDEYNARFAPEEEVPAAPVRVGTYGGSRSPWLLAFPAAAALVALVAWQLSHTDGHGRAAFRAPPTATQVPSPRASAPTAPHTSHLARIVIVASRGPCWLAVRKGTATGPQVFERTLQPGERARFVAKRLWIRFGAPWNTDATLNGKTVRLPAVTADVLVSAAGISSVS